MLGGARGGDDAQVIADRLVITVTGRDVGNKVEQASLDAGRGRRRGGGKVPESGRGEASLPVPLTISNL